MQIALQGTPEWRQDRAGRATASRFADVMATISSGEAAVRKNYRAQLVVERLTGQPTENGFTSKEMQWGIDTEPQAMEAYAFETGHSVMRAGFVKHGLLMAGASPDLFVEEDGLAEIKCPNTAQHIEVLLSGKAPDKYLWQMQGQMWITGREWCDFVSYDPRMPMHLRLKVVRVPRSKDMLGELIAGVTRFLTEVDQVESRLRSL